MNLIHTTQKTKKTKLKISWLVVSSKQQAFNLSLKFKKTKKNELGGICKKSAALGSLKG